MPFPPDAALKPRMDDLLIVTNLAAKILMPLIPGLLVAPRPSMSRPCRFTTPKSAGSVMLMMMAFVEATRTPASTSSDIMLIDLVIVTPPKPPGSSTQISPPLAVLEMAPAKVLHGAVREHGLTSSPVPDTQVRVACAWAGAVASRNKHATAAAI